MGCRRPVAAMAAGAAVALVACSSAAQPPSFTFRPPASAAPSAAPSLVAAPSVSAAPAATPVPSTTVTPSSSGVAPSPSTGGPMIGLAEWTVVAAGAMPAGKVDLTILNNGTIPHELLIFRSNRDPAAYPTDAAGDIKEEGAGVSLISDGDNIDPGGSQTRAVDLTPGKYLFVCNIPGHFKQGMFEVVFVTR